MNDTVALDGVLNETLQEVFFPVEVSIDELYIRFISGYSKICDEGLDMARSSKVSFNTFFNSFYEDYWSNISCVTELFLEIDFSGSILIEVFRDTHNQGCSRIEYVRLDSDSLSKKTISIHAFASGMGVKGRIFVDITAYKKSTIAGLRFTTSTPPIRAAKISVGICTFKREQFLLRNLRALRDLPALNNNLARIIVVNQAATFELPELVELVRDSSRVLLVEQCNLGGCGGFTRTMHEALELEGITHHVLMDDDAIIDPRVLQNLLSLLAYIHDDFIVGGHMLDLLRPHFLYEAGAQVRSNTRIKPLHHNIDLRLLDSLAPFEKFHTVDYNAWWFCVIPIQHIRAAEFPVPIFIRGDDMEYGLRLQARGVKTVAMPGIAVWHEPFYVKVGGWQTYYDLRNRLILASTYPQRFKHESSIDMLWWLLNSAASHDYLSNALLVKAVRDFLRGPSLLEQRADLIHSEVASLAKTLAQPSVALNEFPERPAKLRPLPKAKWRLGLLVAYRLSMILLFARKDGSMQILDHEAHLSNIQARPYVKTNDIGSYRLRYEPDRRRLIRALADSLGAWFAYRRHRKTAAVSWEGKVPSLRSRETWQAIFQSDAQRYEAATNSKETD